MNTLLKKSAAIVFSALTFSSVALAAEGNAHVTLTVTQFRSMNPVANTDFIDATTTLDAHPAVRLVNVAGMPTLRVKRAVNLEISLASADGKETYRPLGVFFRQKTDRSIRRADPEGKLNFSTAVTAAGTVVIQHKFLQVGDDGRYEFFVPVQRGSDGAIGAIDPDFDNEGGD